MATLKFIQASPFKLAGSGASIGDTTLILQSMVGIDGSLLTTTDIGVVGEGTLEPGNGTQEEAIQFTGITQNSNGTATLTGVSTVLFKSPYTATSGIAKTHAGATTFILTNSAAFYGQILSYVDSSIASGGIPATNLVAGIAKLSVAAASASSPIVVGDNDSRIPSATQSNYLSSIIPTAIPYVVAAGTSTAFTATLASSISTLASGTHLNFLAPTTNATGVTLNVNSLGPKAIKKKVNLTLASGDIITGQAVSVVYDGTNYQLTSTPSLLTSVTLGNTSHDVSTTGSQTIAHNLSAIPRYVEITAMYSASNAISSISQGTYDGTNMFRILLVIDTAGTGNTTNSATDSIIVASSTGSTYNFASITVDINNINLTWSKTGSPTGTVYINWRATA